jgi:regulator of protease activity HflC (stomatin/prohibitin superfamily)
MFTFKHNVPDNHICIILRFGHFHCIKESGNHKLIRFVDKPTIPVSLGTQILSSDFPANTIDDHHIDYQLTINYRITDLYSFICCSGGSDSSYPIGLLNMFVNIAEVIEKKSQRMTLKEVMSKFATEYELSDQEAQIVFEGVKRFGVKVVSVKFRIFDKDTESNQYENTYLNATKYSQQPALVGSRFA